ncbi:hypothetical protein [Streptomyces sp. NPDC048521]|uniref:hypothetical protein n=1 Tax=Streptomyces sp. NPDC048521 TaxID=3365566 RepID=UPI00371710F1
MNLVAGWYEFPCLECEGEGSFQVIAADGSGLVSELCSECYGKGVQHLDEEQAAERIDNGFMPTRTPTS